MAVIKKYFPSDPFEAIPEYLIGHVTQHLTFKEALNITEVSSQWYEKTANSGSFVKRIKVSAKCIGGKSNTVCGSVHEDIIRKSSLIARSLRQYSTLEVGLCEQCNNNMNPLYNDFNQEWTHVSFIESHFHSISQLVSCIAMMQYSLETLVIRDVSMSVTTMVLQQWTFTRLTTLKLVNFPSQLLIFCFADVVTLREFHIQSEEQSEQSLNALIQIFIRNSELKTLSMSGLFLIWLMTRFREQELVGTFEFKLREIVVNFPSLHQCKVSCDTIGALMKSQRDSLEVVEFGQFMGFHVLCAAYDLPNLKGLTLKGAVPNDYLAEWKNFKLNVNESIQHLQIHNTPNACKVNYTHTLMAAAPNITSFFINWLDDTMILHITVANPKIRQIFVEFSTVTDETIMNFDLIPNVQSLCINNSNLSSLELIHQMNDATRSNFQRHFYKLFVARFLAFKDVEAMKGHPVHIEMSRMLKL